MPKSAATRAALELLDQGQAPADRKSEFILALALLSGQVPLSPAVLADRRLQPDVLLATLLKAEAGGMWELVLLIRDHCGEKTCAKQAKKILFRAKQRGLWQDKPPEPRAAVDLSARAEPPPSYCTSFDGSGTQVVLAGGSSDADGVHSLVGIVNQHDGLESVTLIQRPSRTRQRTLAEDLARRFDGMVVEVPQRFAAGRLRWALDLAAERDRTVDGDAAAARRLLAGAAPVGGVDTALDPDDETRLVELAGRAGELADEACYARWLKSDADAVMRSGEVLGELPTDEERRTVVAERFAAERRKSLATRFEITAFLLSRAGRRGAALASIATARLLRDGGQHPADIPFLRAALELDAG